MRKKWAIGRVEESYGVLHYLRFYGYGENHRNDLRV